MEIFNYLLAHNLDILVYTFFVLGMLVEGLLFALTVIFLISVGSVPAVPSLLCVLFGAMLEQWLLYYTGKRLANFPRVSLWVNKIAGRFDKHIENRTTHVFVISKFIYGVHRAILIRTGMLNLPMKQFVRASIISVVFWLAVIGLLSYSFSEYLFKFIHYSRFVDVLPFVMIIFFLLVERVAGKYLQRWL